MPSPSGIFETAVRNPSGSGSEGGGPAAPSRAIGNPDPAALAPMPEPVSAAENPVAAAENSERNPLGDSPQAAVGRRILSTAFVRITPGGNLTVELQSGRILVLRDVVLRRKDYCGTQVAESPTRYCGRYAEVAAARPGGA